MMTDLTDYTVLVVDDEIDAQEVVTMILESYGAVVYRALSGEEALQILYKQKPNVTIIDLAMPQMNGWTLFDRMRSDPQFNHIPAVAITAFHSTTVAREAVEAGFAAYFSKPLNAQSFVYDLLQAISAT